MNIKQSYLYFIVATAISIVVRTLMLFFTIDTKSGFVKNEYAIVAGVILGIVVISVVLVFIFTTLTKKTAVQSIPDSNIFKIVSPLLAAVIMYDTLFTTYGYNVTVWQRSCEMVLAVAAAVSLISFTVTEFFHIEFPKILTVLPVFFWFVRLVIIFTSFSSISNIIDNMFELASLCMTLIASLQFSKLACIEQAPKKQTITFAIALSTSSVCFVTSVPIAIVTLSQNATVLHNSYYPILTTLVTGIYFLTFALSCYPVDAAPRHAK